jgi:hypothetical protein
MVIDPPPLRDQQRWLIAGCELARLLISPLRSAMIPNHRSLFIDRWFTVIMGPNLCNQESACSTLSNHVHLSSTPSRSTMLVDYGL